MTNFAFRALVATAAAALSTPAFAQTCAISGAAAPELSQRALIAYVHITDSQGGLMNGVDLGSFSVYYVRPTDNAQSFFKASAGVIAYAGGNYVVRIPMSSPHIADQTIGATIQIRKMQSGGGTTGAGSSILYDCSAFIPKVKA